MDIKDPFYSYFPRISPLDMARVGVEQGQYRVEVVLRRYIEYAPLIKVINQGFAHIECVGRRNRIDHRALSA